MFEKRHFSGEEDAVWGNVVTSVVLGPIGLCFMCWTIFIKFLIVNVLSFVFCFG